MTNHCRCNRLLAIFSLMLIFGIGIAAQTDNQSNNRNQKPDCAQMADADIVKAIYDKIRASKYAGERRHINVRAKTGVVTLEGWTTTKKVRKEIEKFAKKTACVKKNIVNNLTIGISGGCGPGMQRCGDICIPENQDCNIMDDKISQNESDRRDGTDGGR